MNPSFCFEYKKRFPLPGLHLITDSLQALLQQKIEEKKSFEDGMLYIFNPHTSSALTLNEAWDPTANQDLVQFLDYLAPKNLSFIRHTLEGPDDSPAHMKTSLLQSHLLLMVEKAQIILGKWQGVFLAEFRDHPPERTLLIKFINN